MRKFLVFEAVVRGLAERDEALEGRKVERHVRRAAGCVAAWRREAAEAGDTAVCGAIDMLGIARATRVYAKARGWS